LLTWLMSDEERYKEYIDSNTRFQRDRRGLDVDDEDDVEVLVDDGDEVQAIGTRRGRDEEYEDYWDVDGECDEDFDGI